MNIKKYLSTATYSIVSAVLFMFFVTFYFLSYQKLLFSELDIIFLIFTIAFLIAFIFFAIKNILFLRKNKKEKQKIDKKPNRRITFSSIILVILYIIFIALSQYVFCYGCVDAEQIYFHTFVSSSGMDFSTVFTIAIPAVIGGTIFSIVLYYISYAIKNSAKENFKKHIIYFSKGMCWTSVISAILVIIYLFQSIPILKFVYYQNFTSSSFIEEQYVDPKTTKIEFPEQKRNLIYIYMESMENSFTSIENGGAFEQNLIPEIVELQKNNISFSNTDKVGGAITTYGITYTTASIFSQSFGLPLKVGENIKPFPNSMLPQKYNIYDILEDAGYSETVVMGSSVDFGGLKELFTSHGNVNVYDYDYMKENGFIDKNYRVFWGVEDKIMYDLSKEKLTEVSKQDKPFFFVMETVDTHNPDGWLCNECESNFDNRYSNVLACASRQINEFINWSKQQEWYENTTIVIVGDHLTMKNDFFAEIDDDFIRTTTNIIINPSPELSTETTVFNNRQFSIFDMFPTTLASIGCKIDGDRLGLGTNLFSNKKTIFEEFGYEYVNEEFRKKTTFYKNVFE